MAEDVAAELLRSRPYWLVPDRPSEVVAEAAVQCFTSEAGMIVMDRLYWSVLCRSPQGLEDLGRIRLVQELIDLVQQGVRNRQQAIRKEPRG